MSPTGQAMIRSFAAAAARATVEALPPDLARRIFEGAGNLSWLEPALHDEWVALDQHMRIIHAARKVLGPDRFREFHRDLMLAYIDRPALRALLDTAVKILGLTPEGVLTWAPRAWQLMFRDAGTLTLVEPQAGARDHQVTLELAGFPLEHLATFVDALGASFEAVSALTGHATTATVLEQGTDGAGGRARFRVVWT